MSEWQKDHIGNKGFPNKFKLKIISLKSYLATPLLMSLISVSPSIVILFEILPSFHDESLPKMLFLVSSLKLGKTEHIQQYFHKW